MFLYLIFLTCITTTFGDETVKFAAIVYRHGDRTPVNPYPTDPWRNQSFWPVKFGELTNIGKQQHYALGKWLRQRYLHLLSRDFDPSEIYVRSTDVDRTLMSAQANLAGLYPPYGSTVWNSELMWQPIPVHTVPENEDEILAMKKPCPAYEKEYEKYTNSKEFIERQNTYQDLMDYLTKYSGLKVKTYYDIDDIFSTLYIETLYNFTLPNWTHSVFPDKMREPACYSFTTQTGTPLLSRLKVGPLLQHIHSHMTKAISPELEGKHRRVQIYSGHDLTVGSVLNALGMFDLNCPCYTSTVLFELIADKSTSEHYVRISYRNSTAIAEPVVLYIPRCGYKCPVDVFTKLYENLLTVNWEYECTKQFPALLGASFFIGLCIFISIYIAHKIHFARVYQKYSDNSVYTNMLPPPVQSLKAANAELKPL